MRPLKQNGMMALTVVIATVSLLLAGCGGSGSSGASASATSGPKALAAGSSTTLGANSEVMVPAGTIINSPNNTSVTVNGSSNTIVTQAGATVTVPASATGAATNLVTTAAAETGAGPITTPPEVTVIAGSATTSRSVVDGAGTAAVFWGGGHIARDPVSGNLMVSDGGALRQITPTGQVTTLDRSLDWDGLVIDASENAYGTGQASGTWYAASLVKRSPAGVIQTLAANWETSSQSGVGSGGLAIDASGNLYAADTLNYRIVRFTPSGVMSVFAGNGASGTTDGTGTAASFLNPLDLAIDSAGNVWVADGGNGVREISPAGVVTTPIPKVYATSIAVDSKGDVYVSSGMDLIRLDAAGNLTTFNSLFASPGTNSIVSMTTDSSGALYAYTWSIGAQIVKLTFN